MLPARFALVPDGEGVQDRDRREVAVVPRMKKLVVGEGAGTSTCLRLGRIDLMS